MNGFVLAALIFSLVIILIVAGYFVFTLVFTLVSTGHSIADIHSRLDKDESSLTDTRTETAEVATSIIANIASNVQSSKLTVTGMSKTAGDNNLNITANQILNRTTSLPDPSRGAGWLYLTDSHGSNYASLGVANMWADKGITVSPGSCIDFGGGSAMCGDGKGSLTGIVTGTGVSAVTSGVKLLVAPGECQNIANVIPGNTMFPNNAGVNVIVGDTVFGGDVISKGAITISRDAVIGGQFTADASGTRLTANLSDVKIPAHVGLGFTTPSGLGYVDALTITRSLTDNTSVTKVFGSFQVCDDKGANCVTFPPILNSPINVTTVTNQMAFAKAMADGANMQPKQKQVS